LGQALHRLGRSVREAHRLSINFDLKTVPDPMVGSGSHRFWVGRDGGQPALEVLISAQSLSLRTGSGVPVTLGTVTPGSWVNVQLDLDRKARTVSVRLGTPGSVRSVGPQQLARDWDGVLDFVGLDSGAAGTGAGTEIGAAASRPGLCLDNLAIQPEPLAPVSPEVASASMASPLERALSERDALERELASLRGIDGGFEGQKAGSPPAKPWRPGPNSRVRVRPESQSPFTGWMPLGALGIHMPGGLAYDGFGQSLSPAWKRDQTARLHAAFEFRCGEVPAGGGGEPEGTWRFYLGHGAGTSAAVELFWSGSELFRIDGDRAYGLGIADDKQGVALILHVVDLLARAGFTDDAFLSAWDDGAGISYAGGQNGRLVRSVNDGAWEKIPLGTTETVVGIWGASPTDIWLVGSGGMVLRGNGTTFTRVTTPLTGGTWLEVWGLSATEVYITGDAGRIMRWNGSAFEIIPSGVSDELWGIWGPNSTTLFAVGNNGAIIRWDGLQWRRLTAPTNAPLFDVWGTSAGNVFAVGIDGVIVRYDGVSWTTMSTPSSTNLFALRGRAFNDVYAVGNNGATWWFDGTSWRALAIGNGQNLRAVTLRSDGTARMAEISL
jgi:hypothetical protein